MISFYKLHSNPEQLYGYDRMTATPKLAWANTNDDQKKKLESLWAKDPKLAYLYAVNVLHKRFPAGEDTIVTDAAYSYLYAREVLHKRFPAGEDVIARNESYSYLYAKHILRDSDPGSWAERYLDSRKAK